jgi:hypothetical protein
MEEKNSNMIDFFMGVPVAFPFCQQKKQEHTKGKEIFNIDTF